MPKTPPDRPPRTALTPRSRNLPTARVAEPRWLAAAELSRGGLFSAARIGIHSPFHAASRDSPARAYYVSLLRGTGMSSALSDIPFRPSGMAPLSKISPIADMCIHSLPPNSVGRLRVEHEQQRARPTALTGNGTNRHREKWRNCVYQLRASGYLGPNGVATGQPQRAETRMVSPCGQH